MHMLVYTSLYIQIMHMVLYLLTMIMTSFTELLERFPLKHIQSNNQFPLLILKTNRKHKSLPIANGWMIKTGAVLTSYNNVTVYIGCSFTYLILAEL